MMGEAADSVLTIAPLPGGEAFSQGSLHAPADSVSDLLAVDVWGSDPVNVVLTVLAVMTIFYLHRLVNVLPWLFQGVFSFRKLLSMQQSMRLIRERNSVTLMMSLCLCLTVSRFGLYAPSFFVRFTPGVQSLFIIAALLIAAVLRSLLLNFLSPNIRLSREGLSMANHCANDYIITSATVLVPLCPILSLLGFKILIIRVVAYTVLLALFLVFLFRKGQFLSKGCKQLNTILYLCGLEIPPVVFLVLSAIFL